MTYKDVAGSTVAFDDNDFMAYPGQWNEKIARELAREEGIKKLTEKHLRVLRSLRRAFQENSTGFSIRKLMKESGITTKELYTLFPKNSTRKAARIAGIVAPVSCAY